MTTIGRDYANRKLLREVLGRATDADLVEVLSDEFAVRVPKNLTKETMLPDEFQMLHWYTATISPGASIRDACVNRQERNL